MNPSRAAEKEGRPWGNEARVGDPGKFLRGGGADHLPRSRILPLFPTPESSPKHAFRAISKTAQLITHKKKAFTQRTCEKRARMFLRPFTCAAEPRPNLTGKSPMKFSSSQKPPLLRNNQWLDTFQQLNQRDELLLWLFYRFCVHTWCWASTDRHASGQRI